MSTHTADATPASRFARGRRAFRHFRWQRPFWAGLLTMIAGGPILYFPYANVTFGDLTIRMSTTAGAGSLVIGVLMIVLGLTVWFQPQVRVFAGVAAIMLSLVSLVVSNFGGFLLGFLFGLIGGGLSIAWVPGSGAPGPERDGERTAGEPPAATPGTGSALADYSKPAPGRDPAPGKGVQGAD